MRTIPAVPEMTERLPMPVLRLGSALTASGLAVPNWGRFFVPGEEEQAVTVGELDVVEEWLGDGVVAASGDGGVPMVPVVAHDPVVAVI